MACPGVPIGYLIKLNVANFTEVYRGSLFWILVKGINLSVSDH